ncbi:MAG: hypothetical protein WBL31_02440 [Ilumatobacteraceae bacterium]
MHKTLIVANRTVGGDALAAEVRRRVGEGEYVFHLVVPVASPVSAAVAIGAAAGDAANLSPTASFEVADERRIASDRLAYGLDWLRSLGATATGELSTECDPAAAVARIVDSEHVEEVIVSTLPTTISRWLHQDLPHRIERKVKLPVTVVTGSG